MLSAFTFNSTLVVGLHLKLHATSGVLSTRIISYASEEGFVVAIKVLSQEGLCQRTLCSVGATEHAAVGSSN